MSHFTFRPEFIAGIARAIHDYSLPVSDRRLVWSGATLFPDLMELNGQSCGPAAQLAFSEAESIPRDRDGATYLYGAVEALLGNSKAPDDARIMTLLKIFRNRMVHLTLKDGLSPQLMSHEERLTQFLQDYLALSRDGHQVYQDGDWPIRKVTDLFQTQAGERTLYGEQYLMKLAAEQDPLRVASQEILENEPFPYPAELAQTLGVDTDKIPRAHIFVTAQRFHGTLIHLRTRAHESVADQEVCSKNFPRIEDLLSKLDKAIYTHGHLCVQALPLCREGFGMTYREVEKALAEKSQTHANTMSIPDTESPLSEDGPRPGE